MSYNEMSQLSGIFSVGILVASVLMCIGYYSSAKRTKAFTLSRSLTIDELCEVIKAIPSHVFNHKVKRIELSRNNAIQLDCSTVRILITQNANDVNYTYKLNGFINLIFTLAFVFFCIGGAVALLLDGDSTGIITLVLAIGIHLIRGKALNRGRNIVVSIEEHLR